MIEDGRGSLNLEDFKELCEVMNMTREQNYIVITPDKTFKLPEDREQFEIYFNNYFDNIKY